MIGRRDFLRRLITGTAGLTIWGELDLDRLLWVPGQMIAVPESSAFVSWVTRDALRLLTNNLTISSCFNTEYARDYERHESGIVTVRMPKWAA